MLHKASTFAASTVEPGLHAVELRLHAVANRWWETLVRITFGLFVGTLVTLLVLLYGGVLIV